MIEAELHPRPYVKAGLGAATHVCNCQSWHSQAKTVERALTTIRR